MSASSTSSLPSPLKPPIIRLTVVVPVRNEEAFIRQTLEMIWNQDYPREDLEVLVVDGQSTDGTVELVREFAERRNAIRLLSNPRRLSSAGRNIGVRNASGDIVLIIDGHCQLPTRHHFRSVVQAFEESGADVIGRPQPLTIKSASVLQEAIALARASWLGHHPDSYIYTSQNGFVPAASVGAAYRREVFDQIGYFDERFDACEDVEFNHRADQVGLKCFLASEARVNYHPRGTLTGLFHQLARYGRGRVRLARKHPGTFSWRSQAPAALVGLCLLGGALALFQPWAGILWLGLTSAYLATVMLTSIGIALRHRAGWRASIWIACVFVVIHAAAGIGLLQEWLTGSRRWGCSTFDALPSEKCSV